MSQYIRRYNLHYKTGNFHCILGILNPKSIGVWGDVAPPGSVQF